VTDRAVSRWRVAFAGVVAVGAAIATGELAAGLVPGIPSPLLSIGRQVVNLQPPGAKDFMTSLFGTADKLVLQIVIVAAALLIGAGIGLLATRRLELAGAVVAVFAAAGFVATFGDPDAVTVLAAAGAAAEALVGMWILNRLAPIALGTSPGGADGTEGAAQASWPRPSPAIPLSGVAAVKRARAVRPSVAGACCRARESGLDIFAEVGFTYPGVRSQLSACAVQHDFAGDQHIRALRDLQRQAGVLFDEQNRDP